MRYIKTLELLDLTADQISKLQPGQWVTCGGLPRSRFVGETKSGSVWVAHGIGKERHYKWCGMVKAIDKRAKV